MQFQFSRSLTSDSLWRHGGLSFFWGDRQKGDSSSPSTCRTGLVALCQHLVVWFRPLEKMPGSINMSSFIGPLVLVSLYEWLLWWELSVSKILHLPTTQFQWFLRLQCIPMPLMLVGCHCWLLMARLMLGAMLFSFPWGALPPRTMPGCIPQIQWNSWSVMNSWRLPRTFVHLWPVLLPSKIKRRRRQHGLLCLHVARWPSGSRWS